MLAGPCYTVGGASARKREIGYIAQAAIDRNRLTRSGHTRTRSKALLVLVQRCNVLAVCGTLFRPLIFCCGQNGTTAVGRSPELGGLQMSQKRATTRVSHTTHAYPTRRFQCLCDAVRETFETKNQCPRIMAISYPRRWKEVPHSLSNSVQSRIRQRRI